jgi:hypothetical protein
MQLRRKVIQLRRDTNKCTNWTIRLAPQPTGPTPDWADLACEETRDYSTVECARFARHPT